MNTTDLIIILLILLAGAGLYKIGKSLENKITTNRATGKSAIIWEILLGVLVVAILTIRIAVREHTRATKKQGNPPVQTQRVQTQHVTPPAPTNAQPTMTDVGDDFYFIDFRDTPPFNGTATVELTKCTLSDTGPSSCVAKCITAQISNNIYNIGTMPEYNCDVDLRHGETVDHTYVSDTYYVVSSSACMEHRTQYSAKTTTKHFDSQNCNAVKSEPGFYDFSISATDFHEFTRVKLRDFAEFEQLYEKYYHE